MRDTLYKSGASSLVSLLQATDARLQLLQSLDDGHDGLIGAQHQLAARRPTARPSSRAGTSRSTRSS